MHSPHSFKSFTISNSKFPFHQGLAVSNIKHNISNYVTLEMENVQYVARVNLFKVHAHSHRVLDHILQPATDKANVPSNQRGGVMDYS